MKNCQSTSSKTLQDSRLFSDSYEIHEEYDEMPSRRNRRLQRRSNHQTKEADYLLSRASANSQSAMIMKQTHRETNNNNNKHSSNTTTASQTTRMYMTIKRAAQKVANQPILVNQMLRHRPEGLVDRPWSRSLLIGALVTLTLTSCLLVQHTASALENNSHEASHVTSSKSSNQETTKPNERADGPSKVDSLSSSSSEKSIVASLSSAVATAAAAAAVAAAQNSLSSNDARSLSTGSGHHHHNQHGQSQRSPGMNLAIKLVDTIPEVPYNILHNMKKLDHAAPFYNVPNKLSGGTTKELSSTQNFLTNALAASQAGKFGGTAEQLSSLFKSPIWKRIADGYGDFASEFRSLFRPPGAKPMKGPVSPTSKLIRDISVPALLMLLASSISGELRPVRTRRKSFRPVDIPAAAMQSGGQQASAASFLADMKSTATPYSLQYGPEQNQQSQPQSFDQSYSLGGSSPQAAVATVDAANNFAPPTNGDWLEQQQQQQVNAAAARQMLNQQQHQPPHVGPLVRVNGDNNLQPSSAAAESSAPSNWISSMQSANSGQDHHHLQNFVSQSASAYNQQQPAVLRRSDEIFATTNKPLTGGGYTAPNLAALAMVAQGGKLISELLNLNPGGDGALHSYRMMTGLVNGRTNSDKISSSLIKRGDQLLSDKQRYSLVSSDETAAQQHKQPAHLLSAMAHAVTSMLHPSQNVVGKSGSASAESPAKTTAAGFLSRSNLQNLISGGGDKTIYHQDSVFMRRQPQAAEQRDLTKLLPEAWREVVKRTMTTVQQQANTQWKSIEGQLTNWVQDKLKTVAASASPGAPTSGGAAPAPLANKLASISSTALNILGLSKNNSSSPSSATATATAAAAATSAQVSQAKSSQISGDEPIASVANQRGKINESKSTTKAPSIAGGALAGVASMIANVMSDRNNNPAKQSSSPTVSSSSSFPTPKYPNNDHAHDIPQKSQTLGELAASVLANSAVSSIASKYPTLTGSQQTDSVASSPSSAPVPSTSHAPSVPAAQPAAHAPSSASAAAAHPLDR